MHVLRLVVEQDRLYATFQYGVIQQQKMNEYLTQKEKEEIISLEKKG